MLSGKSVLVTGGTDSFREKFVKMIPSRYSGERRVVVFSPEERKQCEMSRKFPAATYPQLRCFIGDA